MCSLNRFFSFSPHPLFLIWAQLFFEQSHNYVYGIEKKNSNQIPGGNFLHLSTHFSHCILKINFGKFLKNVQKVPKLKQRKSEFKDFWGTFKNIRRLLLLTDLRNAIMQLWSQACLYCLVTCKRSKCGLQWNIILSSC